MWRCGIATAVLDPVTPASLQSEAAYASTAIHMATEGGWISPRFLGRFAFFKPPLLFWASALSAKLLGVSVASLRLPSLLAGALVCVLVFAWLLRFQSPLLTVFGVLLLLSDRFFYTTSRLVATDALLVLWITAAMLALAFDTGLRRRKSAWIFGALAGLAILTKAAAGLLPLLALALYWVIVPARERPRFRRVAVAFLAALVVALPWHLYQLIAHTQWFWREYFVSGQLMLAFGAPAQSSGENHPAFYLTRLWSMDPVLCVTAFLALPTWSWVVYKRLSGRATVLGTWGLVTLAGILVFQHRSAVLLLPLIPALALASAEFFPFRKRAVLAAAVVLLAGIFSIKVCQSHRPWGLPHAPEAPLAAAPALEQYCARRRSNPLIIVQPDDRFYAADLPLLRVRYCYLGEVRPPQRYAVDFRYLGIAVTVPEFNQLASGWREVYRQRLREWGLDSGDPLATTILARTPDEVEQMIAAHPGTDFSLPANWQLRTSATHDTWHASARRVYLLAKQSSTAPPRPGWPCRL
ncbi:MAG: ArnT family glycosyltransferase [Bryobacteraceae bacterium]